MDFNKELSSLLNRANKDTETGTPDYILAEYLAECLETYKKTAAARETWFGRSLDIKASV